jgi:hypothetical protein
MTDLLDMVWAQMQAELALLRKDIADVRRISERSETAGGVPAKLVVEAPVDTNTGAGDLLFLTDGLKMGENTGSGTGILAYFNPATNQWHRVFDDADASLVNVGGTTARAFVDLPVAPNARAGNLLFVTDALKDGETPGNGTGTLCYYNSATDTWFRVADDTAASI